MKGFMSKKILFLSLLIASGVLVAGCSKKSSSDAEMMQNTETQMEEAVTPETAEGMKAQEEMMKEPTISNSTNTDDLSKELNDTQIKTEDFSDL